MSAYPKMLFRPGDALHFAGRDLETHTVADAAEHDAARKDGWRTFDELGDSPLDHDGDGKPGGSPKGEASTVRRGQRKKLTAKSE